MFSLSTILKEIAFIVFLFGYQWFQRCKLFWIPLERFWGLYLVFLQTKVQLPWLNSILINYFLQVFYLTIFWIFLKNYFISHHYKNINSPHKRWEKKQIIKLHYSNHGKSFKVFIKSWWKWFLGILVNSIFNPLPMENMTCIRLLSIHYYLVIIANHFTIRVHYVCYVLTTFGNCVFVYSRIWQPLMLLTSRNSCTTCQMLQY